MLLSCLFARWSTLFFPVFHPKGQSCTEFNLPVVSLDPLRATWSYDFPLKTCAFLSRPLFAFSGDSTWRCNLQLKPRTILLPTPSTLFAFPESTFLISSSLTVLTSLSKKHFLLPKLFSDSFVPTSCLQTIPCWVGPGAGLFSFYSCVLPWLSPRDEFLFSLEGGGKHFQRNVVTFRLKYTAQSFRRGLVLFIILDIKANTQF